MTSSESVAGIPRWLVPTLVAICLAGGSATIGGVVAFTTVEITTLNQQHEIDSAHALLDRAEASVIDMNERIRVLETTTAQLRQIVNVQGVIAFERRMTSIEARVATAEFRLNKLNPGR